MGVFESLLGSDRLVKTCRELFDVLESIVAVETEQDVGDGFHIYIGIGLFQIVNESGESFTKNASPAFRDDAGGDVP